jgi:ABC-type antimicrobial peptide transport system permease subunit
MLRNVRERRGELALLGAVGFTPGALGVLVVGEAAGLLSLGLAIGAGSAVLPLVAILPAGGASVSWGGVGGSLVAVFAAGIGATVVALRRARREPIIRALRSE